MNYLVTLIIENGSYALIFLLCIYSAFTSYRTYTTTKGADLAAIGFLLYSIYALLAIAGPGFTGSYFRDFSKVGKVESASLVYFISFTMRLGLILLVIGLFRIGRNIKAS